MILLYLNMNYSGNKSQANMALDTNIIVNVYILT